MPGAHAPRVPLPTPTLPVTPDPRSTGCALPGDRSPLGDCSAPSGRGGRVSKRHLPSPGEKQPHALSHIISRDYWRPRMAHAHTNITRARVEQGVYCLAPTHHVYPYPHSSNPPPHTHTRSTGRALPDDRGPLRGCSAPSSRGSGVTKRHFPSRGEKTATGIHQHNL